MSANSSWVNTVVTSLKRSFSRDMAAFAAKLFFLASLRADFSSLRIRTKLVAPGGEALGGVVGAFRNGVYDILKSAYLHSPEGRKRIQYMKEQGQELSALDQLELGPVRTLLHGAIFGACAEASTYPFEVLRRQLQLQSKANKLSALVTFVKIVERGGIPALYAGLCPS
ncbi:hypothetical protein C3L33_21252, partial [Rhododendron williamsianum]